MSRKFMKQSKNLLNILLKKDLSCFDMYNNQGILRVFLNVNQDVTVHLITHFSPA